MTRIGVLLTLLDGLPAKLLAAPDVGAEDIRVVADRLDHTAARCRTVAGSKASLAAPTRPASIRRARAC